MPTSLSDTCPLCRAHNKALVTNSIPMPANGAIIPISDVIVSPVSCRFAVDCESAHDEAKNHHHTDNRVGGISGNETGSGLTVGD